MKPASTSTPTPNYEFFLHADTSAYKGQWIAIADQKILAHGKDARRVYRAAEKKHPKGNISLAKAPDEQMLVLRFSL